MKYTLFAFMLLLCGCGLFKSEQQPDENMLAQQHACSLYQDQQKDKIAKKVQALFESSIGKTVYFCDANPHTQTCVADAVRMNAKVGTTETLIELPKAKLLTINPDNNFMFFDYSFNVNHTFPTCRAASTSVNFLDCDNAVWTTTPFQCDFSFTEKTTVSMVNRIVYVNFVQKEIGVFYDIRMMGASQGNRYGYALIRFPGAADIPVEKNEKPEYMQFIVDANGNMVSYGPISLPIDEQEFPIQQQ